MSLEIQRRRLDGPPLGPQEQRSHEQMAQAEARTKAPLGEYIDLRERHMQRVFFEVLLISGLPFETSASLAKTILDLHQELWNRDEDPATQTAIGEMSVPTTPLDKLPLSPVMEAFKNAPVDEAPLSPEIKVEIKKSERDIKRGAYFSWEVVKLNLDGKIPHLQLVPKKPQG